MLEEMKKNYIKFKLRILALIDKKTLIIWGKQKNKKNRKNKKTKKQKNKKTGKIQ